MAAVVLLATAAIVALPYIVDTPRVQALVIQSATQALGRHVKFSSLSVVVFPIPAIKVRGLEIAEDPRFGTNPFLAVATGRLHLRLLPLLGGRLEFGEFVLEEPRLSVIQDSLGRLNIASLGASAEAAGGRPGSRGAGGAAAAPVVSQIRIVDGVVRYELTGSAGARTAYTANDLDLTVRGSGPTTPLEFGGDARIDPGGMRLSISDGSVAQAGARLLAEAPLRAKLSIEATEVGELAAVMVGPSPQLSGTVKGTLSVGGTVGAPTASGELEIPALAVTDTPPGCREPKPRSLTIERVRVPVTFASGILKAQPVVAHLGRGTLQATVVIDLRDAAPVRLNETAIRSMPLSTILVDYLCQAYAVTGPLDLTGEFAVRPGNLWGSLAGSGELRIGAGKVLGGEALSVLSGLTGIASTLRGGGPTSGPLEFDSITATFTITNGVVSTRDLRYRSRLLNATAVGDYRLTDGRLSFDVLVTADANQARAKVTGTAAAPAVQLVPGDLRVDPRIERGVRDLLRRLR
jgi:uncharacterized protein involved in outer membrane biogenesis